MLTLSTIADARAGLSGVCFVFLSGATAAMARLTGQVDSRLLAALRVMFTRSKKEMEGKTATELGRYKVCNNE